MRAFVTLLVVCVVGGVSLWGYGTFNARGTIKIGVLVSPDTALGAETNFVAKAYADRFSAEKDSGITFVLKNPPIDSVQFERAYKELEAEGVSLIVGGAISRTGVMLSELAATGTVPVISPNASSERLAGQDDGLVRLVMSTKKVGVLQANYLNSKGFQRLAVLVSPLNRAYSASLAKEFSDAYHREHRLFNLASDTVIPAEFFEYRPDCVLLIASSNELLQFLDALQKANTKLKVYSVDWAFLALWSYSSSLLNNVEFLTQMGELTPAYKPRIADYEQRYSQTASFGSHQAFSSIEMALRAVEETDGSRQQIRAYFEAPRVYEYAYGRIFLDHFGDATGQYLYVWSSNNGIVSLKDKIPVTEFPP